MPGKARPALLLVLALAAGCAGDRGFRNDPLYGGGSSIGPPAPIPGPATAGSGTTGTATAGVPPIPPSNPTASTAGLAAGLPADSDPGHKLRIEAVPTGGAATPGSGARAPAGAEGWQPGAPATQPGAALQGPVPIGGAAGATTPPGTTPPAVTPPAITPGLTLTGGPVSDYGQIQAMLKARNVQWEKLEMVGDGNQWRFSCGVPIDPKQPGVLRRYETRVPIAGTGIEAMRDVLDQINRDLH